MKKVLIIAANYYKDLTTNLVLNAEKYLDVSKIKQKKIISRWVIKIGANY